MSMTQTQMLDAVFDTTDRASASLLKSGNTFGDAAAIRLNWALDEVSSWHQWSTLTAVSSTLTMIPSQKTYAIPATMRALQTIRWVDDADDNGEMLSPFDNNTFDDYFPYPEGQSEGQPTSWTKRGGNFEVNAIPGTGQCSLVTGTDANSYYCILNHTAAAANKPITGGSYATYWTLSTSSSDAETWADGTEYFTDKFYLSGFNWPVEFAGASSTSGLPRDLDKVIIYLAVGYMFELIDEEAKADFWSTKAKNIVDEIWAVECALSEG